MGLDARIRYTKAVIKDTFIVLLKEKPVNKVTVKEICDLAEINRATFYRYYSNPFDLLDKIELEMLSQMKSSLKTSPRSFREIFTFIMDNIRADGERYQVLASKNGDSKFPGRIFPCTMSPSVKSSVSNFRIYLPLSRNGYTIFLHKAVVGFWSGGLAAVWSKTSRKYLILRKN